MSLYDDYLKTKGIEPIASQTDASSASNTTQSSGGLYEEFQASKNKSVSNNVQSSIQPSSVTPSTAEAVDAISVPKTQPRNSFIPEQKSTRGGFVGWLENGGLWQYGKKVPGLKEIDRLGAAVIHGVGSVIGSVEELGGTILDNTVGRIVDKVTDTPYEPTHPIIIKAAEDLKNNINRTMGSNDKAFGNEVIDTIGGFIPWIYGGAELKGATMTGKIAPLVANLGMSGVQSLIAAQQDYKESIDSGKAKGQAMLNSLGVFSATLATNYIAHKIGFFANPESASLTKAIGSWLKTMAIEDVSLGGIQTMISNVSQGRAPFQGVAHNMLVNLPAIALFSGAGELQNHADNIKAESQVKDFLEKVYNSGGTIDDAVKAMSSIVGKDEISVKKKVDDILIKNPDLNKKFEDTKTEKDVQSLKDIAEQINNEQLQETSTEPVQQEKVSLTDVTAELTDAGYSKQDIARMTADLYRENPSGNFTREQIDTVKQGYLPRVKDVVTITKDLKDKGYSNSEIKQIVTELHKVKPDADFTNADVNAQTQKLKGEDLYNIKAEEEAFQKAKQEKEAVKQQKIQEREKIARQKFAEKQKAEEEAQRLKEEKQNIKDKIKSKKLDAEKRESKAKIKEIEAKIKEIEARIAKWEKKKEKIDAQARKSKVKENKDVFKARSNNIKAIINSAKTKLQIKTENLHGLKERIDGIDNELKGLSKTSKPLPIEKNVAPEKVAKVNTQKTETKTEPETKTPIIKEIKNPIPEKKQTEPVKTETPSKTEPAKTEIRGKFAQRLQEFLKEGAGKDIPDAERRTWIKEGRKFQEIVDSDPNRIGAILRGDEPLPEGMTPGVFIKQAALYLRDNPDVSLMQDFANNVLQGQISEAARITASGRAISNDTFSENIREAQTAVKRGIDDRVLETRKNDIVKEGEKILKDNVEKETLDTFLDDNLC